MGEFTQNLLKLTEFPFSYSLIGLLALIFGQSINLQDLSLVKVGPFLLLMGFVATTLSICDPVGGIQRKIISGSKVTWKQTYYVKEAFSIENESEVKKLMSETHGPFAVIDSIKSTLEQTVFGTELLMYFEGTYDYLLSIIYPPNVVKERYRDNLLFVYLLIAERGVPVTLASDDKALRLHPADTVKLQIKVAHDFLDIFKLLDSLRQSTVRTKWITAEIDRITALVYFLFIISLFVVATTVTLINPQLLSTFAESFGNVETTKIAILILSIIGAVGVGYMLKLRIKGLRRKASTVLRYLISIQTIKIAKEDYNVTLRDIERYLNDSEWALGEYWLDRIQSEYSQFFYQKIREERDEDIHDKKYEGVA